MMPGLHDEIILNCCSFIICLPKIWNLFKLQRYSCSEEMPVLFFRLFLFFHLFA